MQVKGFMPLRGGISGKHPPAKPLRETWYGITFPAVREFVMPWGQFYRNCRVSKNRRCTIAHSNYGTSPIMCFCLDIMEHLIPLVPPLTCHCNMDNFDSSRKNYIVNLKPSSCRSFNSSLTYSLIKYSPFFIS